MKDLQNLLVLAREAAPHPNPQLRPVFDYLQARRITELEALVQRREAESQK